MNTTFMEAISITISSMTIVLLTLALIAVILSLFKAIFKEQKKEQAPAPAVNTNTVVENDEEERLVACLAASAMAGNGKINPNLHIRRVTRIK